MTDRHKEVIERLAQFAGQRHRSTSRQFALDCFLAGVEAVRELEDRGWCGCLSAPTTISEACDAVLAAIQPDTEDDNEQ